MKHILLTLSLIIHCLFSSPAQTALGVKSVSITVSDLDQAIEFYTGVLPFRLEKIYTLDETETGRLFGLTENFGQTRIARLRLGDETIELMAFGGRNGRPRVIPSDSRSNDRWFQHIAIVVSDIDQAYRMLRQKKVTHVSSSPQTLPVYLPNAAGISAFYFQDQDGHNLELIQFPAGKGNPVWQQKAAAEGSVFLGIDHTAIGIDDTDSELGFYRDLLGLAVGGNSENYGTEQEHLNQVFGAHLLITGLHAQKGFGVEFLEYLAPPGGRNYPEDSRPDDLWHWHTTIEVAHADALCDELKTKGYRLASGRVVTMKNPDLPFQKACLLRDPVGHAVLLTEPRETR